MKKIFWKPRSNKTTQANTGLKNPESFVQSESGLMTILALTFVMIVFAVGGFAVDIMRFDRERARLQYALDRAVLAAADLEQNLCPKDVIKDYLNKEGLEQYLVGEPVVTPDLCGSNAVTVEGYRRVEAHAEMDVAMHFMQWWDVDSINTTVTSVAEEAIGDVEISLVLDVSGSMNNNNRLPTLKAAAKNFVQEMVDKTEDGKLSISIIPYATQVALPDYVMPFLQTSGQNDHANCVNFTTAEFATNTFDFGLVRPKTLHFTPWYTYDRRPTNGLVSNEICDRRAGRQISILQKDATVLKNHIDSFQAGGNTSIDLGMKWGLTLLDQSFRPVVAALAGNQVPAEFASRPSNYASNDAMKVIVLMTDGANTTQYEINDPYRSGPSILWWNSDHNNYSTYDHVREQYYWHNVNYTDWDSSRGWYWGRDIWQDKPYGNDTYNVYRCTYRSNGVCYQFDRRYSETRTVTDNNGDPSFSVQLDWHHVWERTSRRAIRDLFREALGRTNGDNWYNNAVTLNGSSQKDPRTKALCDQAKANDIFVFTIALEAPQAGRDILWYCKTDENTYYNASPGNLPDVFASIGSSIRNLRLTQ
nr:pilus assembly protein TadG-related protein [uncultured Ruegeria sp.]